MLGTNGLKQTRVIWSCKHTHTDTYWKIIPIFNHQNPLTYFTFADFAGVLQQHKWEGTINLDSVAWGYRRNAKGSDYRSIEELLGRMAEVISCGGLF